MSGRPERTCVGCRVRRCQDELVRLTVHNGGLVEGTGRPGRGAYVCRGSAVACFDAATKARRWGRALRAELDPSSFGDVRDALRLAFDEASAPPGLH